MVVNADRQRIEQVLSNLIQNAIKYSRQSRRVEVQVAVTVTMTPATTPATIRATSGPATSGTEVVVSVRDYGVGIPAEAQAHVFERFFRADNIAPTQYAGLGLGLYIAYDIVSRHGGRMWLESTEGAGSTFYFALPLWPHIQ
jgi:signal transduction histidine kinase